MNKHINPFLTPYATPCETVPFDKILFTDYEEAMLEGMKREDADVEKCVNNPEPPTFENTIVRENDDRTLIRVTTVFFNLLSAHTNDEMDSLAQKMSPLLTEHSTNILLNERLFDRVKTVYENPGNLTTEEQKLLDNTYEGFERNGATLCDEDKKTFRSLNQELSLLSLQFSQNELKSMNAYQLHLTDEADLDGLPQTAIDAAALAAKEKDLEGWIFTLHAPSMTPFMTYSNNRELRRQMYMARNTICTSMNAETNNEEIVKKIVNIRLQIAKLLGYPTWADYVLKRRMAENVENVEKLLNQLLEAYLPTAKKEVAEIEKLAKDIEGDDFQLMPWDFAHYAHLLKMQRYNIDAEMLRPYLELSKVKEGVFGLATRLYGITFHRREDIATYHEEAEAWEVRDKDGSYLALLYTDFHPRSSKQSGAWMTSYKEQWTKKIGDTQEDSRPHVSVTMNFTKPTETQPALLTLGEVETFLHEFGHALHGIFSKVHFEGLSCTNVYWDFVELPSQFMENYAIEPEFLNTFAHHYETGETIPAELIERVRNARNFNVAYACIRQLSFGMLDMAYHTLSSPLEENIELFEEKAWKATQLLPHIEGTCMSVQFGHIMSGGYSAGYYSYKWAEVLDADAFSLFQQTGIFNTNAAQSFRDEILSKGGTEHPMTLYKRFRKKEPSIDALLTRNGIK